MKNGTQIAQKPQIAQIFIPSTGSGHRRGNPPDPRLQWVTVSRQASERWLSSHQNPRDSVLINEMLKKAGRRFTLINADESSGSASICVNQRPVFLSTSD